jgi:hypothetical protein
LLKTGLAHPARGVAYCPHVHYNTGERSWQVGIV